MDPSPSAHTDVGKRIQRRIGSLEADVSTTVTNCHPRLISTNPWLDLDRCRVV